MRLVRCANGHMFNAKKYGNVCPYCEMSVEQTPKQEVRATQTNRREMENDDDQDKTMPFFDEYEGLQPVVGWLVCIEGANVGQDYRIRIEKNFIGRSDEMHIQISGDNSISRRNHAIIIYDPKKRNFVLKSGDSSGLIYLNDEAVYSPEELNPYDVIQMGRSKFIFVPLCGIHFEWDNLNEKTRNDNE